MAAHQYAEKLILLDLHVNGLLCRVHDMINFKKRLAASGSTSGPLLALLDTDLAKFITVLSKKFPEVPDNLEKAPGYDIFHKRATDIHTGLKDYYDTFLDVMNFKEACWTVLVDCCKHFTDFRFDVNRYLMTKFIDLFVKYVQLLILVSRIPDRRPLLILYAQAHHKTGNTETNFLRVAEFLKQYDNPVVKLREECSELTERLNETLMTLMGPIMTWSEIGNFHTKSVFNILDNPGDMTVSTKEKEYQELMHLDTFQNWMMFVYLICPGGLQSEGAVPMLLLCLKEHFQAVVFRNETLDIQHEYTELFKNFQVKKAGAKTFKLSTFKKQLAETQAEVQATVTHHAKLRTYLQCEMDTMLHFFTEFPGCIAPKLTMIMAAVALARNCVVWYFRHKNVVPFKKPKTYQFIPDQAGVAQLIKLIYAFKNLVLQHTDYIQKFFVAHLQHDVEQIKAKLPHFKQTANLSPLLEQLIDSILEHGASGDISNYESVRLNWYRVSAGIFHVSSGIGYTTASGICPLFIELINHTRYVDLLTTQLRSCSTLMNMVWHPEQLKELASQAPPDCFVAITQTLSDSLHNIQRLGESEAPYIVAVSQHLFHELFFSIMKHLMGAVSTVKQNIQGLREQANHNSAIEKIKDDSRRFPGFESQYAEHGKLKDLKSARDVVIKICSSLHQVSSVHVCLVEFYPFEFLRETVQKQLRAELRALVCKKPMMPPSQMLTAFKDTYYAYQTIEQGTNLNVSNLVRECMFTAMGNSKYGGPGDHLPLEDSPQSIGEDDPLINHIARNYLELFQGPIMTAGSNTFSETLMSFVNGAGATTNTENLTDPSELRALCAIIGPYGVRTIDAYLLKVVSQEVEKIKQMIQNNQTVLTPLVGKSMYAESWNSAVNSVTANDKEIISSAAAKAGCVLKFRKILRRALEAVVSTETPFVYNPVKVTHSIIHDVEPSNANFANLDLLAMDCGIPAGESDHALRNVLSKFKTNSGDVNQWALLPEMMGISFKSLFWRNARYSVALDGHHNNAHCMDECIVALIVNLNFIGVSQTAAANQKITEDLERFVQCASYSVLHLLKQNARDESIQHIMMFIEMFIARTSGRVQLAFLETCFPYTLLRTNYIQLYERQTAGDGTAYSAADQDDEKKAENQEPAAASSRRASKLASQS